MHFYGPSSFGTLKMKSLNFLSKDLLLELIRCNNVGEIAQRLESTWYGPDIEAATSEYKQPEAMEVALNRHLVEVNKVAVHECPMYAKNALLTYLSKWDIENIELIIAAKILGRGLEQTEAFLMSSRNVPVGLFSSVIPLSVLHSLLQQPDVEAVLNSLVKYGYGAVLLQQLGEFRKSGDLGVFSSPLQNLYYSKLLWELRFLQGDEGVLREYIRAEISKKNILLLLKSKESNLDKEILGKHLIGGGLIGKEVLLESYSSPALGDIGKRLEPWLDLSAALEKYCENHNLTEVEVSMDKIIVAEYLPKFRSFSISLTTIFAFVLQSEIERQNIRRITYSKVYGMPEEYTRSIILTW